MSSSIHQTSFPSQILWENYPYALSQFPAIRALKNTSIIILTVEFGRLLTASMAAFVFARIRFPFRNKLFLVVLSTMMIPYHVTLVPQYSDLQGLGNDRFFISADLAQSVWRRSFLHLLVCANSF